MPTKAQNDVLTKTLTCSYARSMNLKLFGVGTGLGVVSAIPFLLLTALFSRWSPDTNLVNFSPAIIGIGLLTVEISLALISLILGGIWLVRQRWKRAGFGLAFSIVLFVVHLGIWLGT
jgi:hypothetical protein